MMPIRKPMALLAPRPKSSQKFLRDLIAGRPVFTHPSEAGGFRLRYGRARNHGFATGGSTRRPCTSSTTSSAGTQIKTERPGKARGHPRRLHRGADRATRANGEVRRIDDPEEAKEIRNGVEKVLDLGEYLVNYGEFVENNHPLAPASYVYEWWVQEFETAGADVQAMRDDPTSTLNTPMSTRRSRGRASTTVRFTRSTRTSGTTCRSMRSRRSQMRLPPATWSRASSRSSARRRRSTRWSRCWSNTSRRRTRSDPHVAPAGAVARNRRRAPKRRGARTTSRRRPASEGMTVRTR